MKNFLFLAVGLLLISTSCTDRTKAINFQVRGKKAYTKGLYEKALPLFNKALELDPDFDDAHDYKIMTLERLELWEEAIGEYDYKIDRTITTGDTTSTYAMYSYGTPLENLASLYFSRAEAKNRLGREQEALEDYTLSLQNDPDHISALCERGFIYFKNQEYTSAIIDLTVAAEYGMNRAEYDLANAYHRLDSIDAACRHWYESGNYQITEEHKEMGLKPSNEYYDQICLEFYSQNN